MGSNTIMVSVAGLFFSPITLSVILVFSFVVIIGNWYDRTKFGNVTRGVSILVLISIIIYYLFSIST